MAPRGWIIEVRYIQGNAEIVQRYDVAIAILTKPSLPLGVSSYPPTAYACASKNSFLMQHSLALALSPAPFIPEFAAGAS